MDKFKKIFLSFIFLLLVVALIGCASNPGFKDDAPSSPDGIPFYQYKTFEYNGDLYEIYRLETIDFIDSSINNSISTLKYYYTEYEKLETSSWTINYFQDLKRFISLESTDRELIECFYTNIKDTINEYDKLLEIDLEIYTDETNFEKEFIVDFQQSFSSVLVIDVYLPYRLINKTTNETYNFNVPVKSFLAYRNNDSLRILCDNINFEIKYSDFISLSNVTEI